MVLARKCRPKILEDIIGQPVVVQTLSNAISKNKLHHAYMFVGQFGSGKTTIARIVACMENCKVSPGIRPCGTCDICIAIHKGIHADVLEVDAASSAGKVEHIRELKKEALYNPVDGAVTKYFIIDEVHAASQNSNDALLKILEEPPENTRFILCTTDIQKVRPAIISRCQRHDFNRIFWMEMAEYLERVAQDEGVNVDRGALNLCARMGKGSMRNALQNLEKLMSYSGDGDINISDAEKMFGSVSETLVYDLMDEIVGVGTSSKPDTTKGFKIINKMLRDGGDYHMLVDGFADHLHTMLIGLTSSKAGDLVHLSEEGKKRVKEQVKKAMAESRLQATLRCLDHLNNSNVAVSYGLLSEMALQKWFVESIFEFRR